MKYLITGGAGFIGSNFIKYMINKYPNDNFVCLDLLTYASSIEALKDVENNPNFKFVYGDICDKDLITNLFKEEAFDYVVNFAAESDVDRSFLLEELFYKTNVEGVKILLEAAIKFNVKRFHQVSTDEVYGPSINDIAFTEESPLYPTTPYSKSKAMADEIVLDIFSKYNLNVTISRSTNNYGCYQHPEKLIPKVVKMALNKENITVYGNGLNMRDWLYVADHSIAIDLILHQGKNGEIYNINGDSERTNLWIVKEILKLLNLEDSHIIYTSDRPIDDCRYLLNSDKIKTELNWRPTFNFDEQFKKTINWFKENNDWLIRISRKSYIQK